MGEEIEGPTTVCPRCLSEVPAGAPSCGRCNLTRPRVGWRGDPYLGRLVNQKYRIQSRLGAGGFGLVYLARQVNGEIDLGEVVLKFLRTQIARQPAMRRRFINEVRAARTVHSPHVVQIFDLDVDGDDTPFMVMEYIRGESLRALLKRDGRLPPRRTLRIALQVAEALSACHLAKVVHRDLKPDNLLLLDGRSDFVKLLDFGIARIPNPEGTQTGALIGTPRYMAPEQVLQRPVDQRADLYALGVILYECLAGRPPLDGGGPAEQLQLALQAAPPPLRAHCPELPESLERLLAALMAKDPEDRPANASDLEQELRRIGVAMRWLQESDLFPVPAETREPSPGEPASAVTRADTALSIDVRVSTPAPASGKPGLLPLLVGAAIVVALAGGLLIAMMGPHPDGPTSAGRAARPVAVPDAARLDSPRAPDATMRDRAAPVDVVVLRAPAALDLRRPIRRVKKRPGKAEFKKVPGGL